MCKDSNLKEEFNNGIDMSKYREMLYMAPRHADYISNLLKESVNKNMSLEELIDKFYEMSKIPVVTESDLLLFETYNEEDNYVFSLIRQTDEEGVQDSYFQLNLLIEFEKSSLTENIKQYSEWDDGLEENFFDFIKKSEAFLILKNQKVKNIKIYGDGTD